jgi:hypothetical protein
MKRVLLVAGAALSLASCAPGPVQYPAYGYGPVGATYYPAYGPRRRPMNPYGYPGSGPGNYGRPQGPGGPGYGYGPQGPGYGYGSQGPGYGGPQGPGYGRPPGPGYGNGQQGSGYGIGPQGPAGGGYGRPPSPGYGQSPVAASKPNFEPPASSPSPPENFGGPK